ncbi:DTW domain-containing protein YfiP [Vibrio gazogenes DSM 21264]|uniref:tRNA-uridine aminocarboxypropyltransferase n=2 Tax=Vibrio gazogenes TaxID=687 RepID=A0A1M5GBE0_VIBGA|nr:DTW domain-containing protein YfiP [Vibrio gazogenes DSM 21264] [Vibrio gazogenes DSM 21264 = NBRC 103151]SJN55085.1 DTW domain protein [Vibrio gazogenes]
MGSIGMGEVSCYDPPPLTLRDGLSVPDQCIRDRRELSEDTNETDQDKCEIEMGSRYCIQCQKAHKACLCSTIVPLSSAIELIILQHPTEVRKPAGTASILTLSLENAVCLVGENFTQDETLNALLNETDVAHFVLFPGEGSACVSDIPAPSPSQRYRVILLDGTWKKAYKMWQLSTILHELPRLHLPESLQSCYLIRKAPRDNCLSTVEAGYHVLSNWQPDQDFSPLLHSFEQMIQFQLAQMPPEVRQRYEGDTR